MREKIVAVFIWLVPSVFFLFPVNLVLSNAALLLVLFGAVWVLPTWHTAREMLRGPAAWLLALFAMVLIGTLYSSAPWSWISINIGKYAKFVYAVVLMLLFMKIPALQKRALWGFAGAMLLTLILTLINQWIPLPWSTRPQLGWGVFGDHITQNVMMSFFVIFALSKVKKPWFECGSFFWIVSAITAIFSITHLSTGRTGLVVLFAALAAWMGVHLGLKRLWVGLPILILSTMITLLSSELLRDRFALAWQEAATSDIDVMSNIGHRLYNYKITPKLIAESPFVGHGTGAYHTEICRFLDKPEWCSIFNWHSHNQFLFFAADYGLIGVFLYLGLIFSLYRTAWQTDQYQSKLLLVCLTTILMVDSLINTPLYSSIESHFFLYMMALLVAMSRLKKT
jgi:O-antigen ligase